MSAGSPNWARCRSASDSRLCSSRISLNHSSLIRNTSLLRLPATATQEATSGDTGDLAVIVFHLAADDGVFHACGELDWIDEGGAVNVLSGIEHSHVREVVGL